MGPNAFQAAFQAKDNIKQNSPMPAPNMQQAGGMPQAQPSPFPSSGFAKQGTGGGARPNLPTMFDEQ